MKLMADNVELEKKVVDMTDKFLKAHDDSAKRITLLLPYVISSLFLVVLIMDGFFYFLFRTSIVQIGRAHV